MSKDKYPSIFSPQMEAIVFIIFQIFPQRAQFSKLGNILGYCPVFGHVTHLDQPHASEKIRWIINTIRPTMRKTARVMLHWKSR